MFPGAEGGPQGFRTEVLFGANLSLSQPMDQMMVPAQDVVAGKYKASRPEADGNGVAPAPSLVDWAPVPGVTRRLNAGAPEDQQMSGGSDGGEDRGRGSTCSSRLSRPHVTLGALSQTTPCVCMALSHSAMVALQTESRNDERRLKGGRVQVQGSVTSARPP